MYELITCCDNNPVMFHNGKWHCMSCYIALASSERYDDDIEYIDAINDVDDADIVGIDIDDLDKMCMSIDDIDVE